jgi:two-component sensor histidine kinase
MACIDNHLIDLRPRKPQAGQAMAMVLHELVTNAAKYGALSVPGGHVSVHWMRSARSGFCIHWQERGGPHVVPQIHSGYGTSVIRDMIPYSLGGAVNLIHARDGVRCKVEIPDRWVIRGIQPAIVRPVDATPPCSLETERPTPPNR